MIDNLIRENCNLTIINFNKRFVCFKILKSDFNICILYFIVLYLYIFKNCNLTKLLDKCTSYTSFPVIISFFYEKIK